MSQNKSNTVSHHTEITYGQTAVTAKGPTTARQRYIILDALRGLALMGIALANFPEFALWTFLSDEARDAMSTASVDHVVRFLQYLLVDGKYYSIFSILFGIGFSIILSRHGTRLFLRRMMILVVIGFLHLMFIWSGDILLLYAIGGLLLSLFVRFSDRTLLWVAALLILVPVGMDAAAAIWQFDLAKPFYDAWWRQADAQGINEENFASWLRDADSYGQIFAFLIQGAYERVWEFVEGHRLPKVLGLFIIGYVIGRQRLYARLSELPLCRWLRWLWAPSLVGSILYAWSAVAGHPWGGVVHSLLYALSVIPMAICYILLLCLFYRWQRYRSVRVLRWLASPGRMALSCYISQSLIGVLLFYGLGKGWGTHLGLVYVELVALGVFIVQIIACHLWLRAFRFGPIEWVWRMLTYGKWFRMRT